MTLEEATKERATAYWAWAELEHDDPKKVALFDVWRETVARFEFLAANPTQQLCLVAQQLKEDTK